MPSRLNLSIGTLLLSLAIIALTVACSDSTLDSSSTDDEGEVTIDQSQTDSAQDMAQADESAADMSEDTAATDESADVAEDEGEPDEATDGPTDESEADVAEETVEDIAEETAEDLTEDPDSTDSADETQDAAPCSARANRCASRAVEACVEGAWVETSVCESTELCTGQGWCEDIPDFFGNACRGDVTALCTDPDDGYDFDCMGPAAILICRSANPILAEEGDECISGVDCPRSGGFLCSRAGYCQDGSVGDRCYNAEDCSGDLVCVCPTSGVRCGQWEQTCEEPS